MLTFENYQPLLCLPIETEIVMSKALNGTFLSWHHRDPV